jgi:S1-C subfamily serine protease
VSIDPDGPAARAGLLVGDIVLTMQNRSIAYAKSCNSSGRTAQAALSI